MKKNLFFTFLLIFTLTSSFCIAADNIANFTIRSLITKIGFYSASKDLNNLDVTHPSNLTDANFDIVKTLTSPRYVYFTYDASYTPPSTTLETISDIPVGEYYVFAFIQTAEYYYNGDWVAAGADSWSSVYFSLNGTCIFNNTTQTYTTLNINDFLKVIIQPNKNTSLTQIQTNHPPLPGPEEIITFVYTANTENN